MSSPEYQTRRTQKKTPATLPSSMRFTTLMALRSQMLAEGVDPDHEDCWVRTVTAAAGDFLAAYTNSGHEDAFGQLFLGAAIAIVTLSGAAEMQRFNGTLTHPSGLTFITAIDLDSARNVDDHVVCLPASPPPPVVFLDQGTQWMDQVAPDSVIRLVRASAKAMGRHPGGLPSVVMSAIIMALAQASIDEGICEASILLGYADQDVPGTERSVRLQTVFINTATAAMPAFRQRMH